MSVSPPATLAYILKGYPRISETFISNEILLLEQLGLRVRLFPMRRPRESFCHDSVTRIKARVDYLPTELLLDLPKLIGPNIRLAVAAPARYRGALATAAARFRRSRKIATWKHLFQAGYLAHRHLLRDPTIVHLHAHFAHSPTSVAMFASHLSDLPFSFTAHAKDIYTSRPEQLREKIALARFVATCTRHNERYLRDLAPGTQTPIHCFYHGIDLSLFTGGGERTYPVPPYRLLTVARLTEKKGLPTVLAALRLLADRRVPFHHWLVGDGEDREKILSLISELDLSGHCTWLGTRTHTEVLEQFRTSDCFVLGCKVAANGDRDGIPNVLVESLAMGVPAVAPDVSAIPEILRHEETGLTVGQEDGEALAEAIVRLLTDHGLRRRVIERGRRLVETDFDNRILISGLAHCFATTSPRLLPGFARNPTTGS